MNAGHVAAIWMAADVVVTLGCAWLSRRAVDRDGDGKISHNELPNLSSFLSDRDGDGKISHNGIVTRGARLYDFTLLTVAQVLVEAFLFSFGYGVITVLTCNWLLVGRVDDRVGWLIATWLVFVTCVFMCAFSTNGIHVATNHVIHFVYYGCGFAALALYWRPPDFPWLMPVYILLRLGLHTAVKYVVWPGYPSLPAIFPLYAQQAGEPTWAVVSRPDDKPAQAPKGLLRLAVPFPCFECLNTHVTSSLAIGAVVGCCIVASAGATGGGSSPAILLAAACGSAVLTATLYSLPCAWMPLKRSSLSRFWPRLSGGAFAAAGAAMVVVNSTEGTAASLPAVWGGAGVAALVVGHVSHVAGAGLFAYSYVAGAKHFGWWTFCMRCGPKMGNAAPPSSTREGRQGRVAAK